jgi:hypothetical protein
VGGEERGDTVTPVELATIAAYIATNWPRTPMTEERTTVYAMELSGFDAQVVLAVIRSRFADERFAPTPLQIRAAVVEATEARVPDADEVYNELLGKISSVGYMSPEPGWSHPLIGTLVAARGGWRAVCESTPTQTITGSTGSVSNTFRAQLRDEWNATRARASSARALASLDAGAGLDAALLAGRREID